MLCYTAEQLIELLKQEYVDQGKGDEPLMWEFVGRQHCERYAPNITKQQFRDIVQDIDETYIANEFHDCIKNIGNFYEEAQDDNI